MLVEERELQYERSNIVFLVVVDLFSLLDFRQSCWDLCWLIILGQDESFFFGYYSGYWELGLVCLFGYYELNRYIVCIFKNIQF